MKTFDEIKKNALEETVAKKAKEIYERYYGYAPKVAGEKIAYKMETLEKYYNDCIEEL